MSQFALDGQQMQQLYRYAFALSQHSADAKDLLHNALERYWRELQAGKHILHPQAYLRSCIRNRFIDECRHQQRWPSESYEEHSAYDISPMDFENSQIQQQQLAQLWPQLAVQDRDILYHWAVLGYSTDEACEQLGLPRGTFLARIHRLRKACQAFKQAQEQAQ